jgi:RNase adapter protein RapZ
MQNKTEKFHVSFISFGYKTGELPVSNLAFDVRFLKNPYWEESLRPFSGKDAKVREYVLSQPAAIDFLNILLPFLKDFIGCLRRSGATETKIAFGCTGGQHRSVAIVEAVAAALQEIFPDVEVTICHSYLQEGNQQLAAGYESEHIRQVNQ